MAALNLTQANLSQFEGYRIRQAGQGAIFLILDGRRHHIPNPATSFNLFGENDTVHEVLDLEIVPDGGGLSDGACLARSKEDGAVFLVTNGQKRHVSSPDVAHKFGFDGRVEKVMHVLIDFIPTGNPVT